MNLLKWVTHYRKAGGGSNPTPSLILSGGTITAPEGYQVATFTSSGKLTVTGSGTLYAEIVAAGGAAGDPGTGSGGKRGGGGGAGEVHRISQYVTAGEYDIVVGAAGAFASQSPGGDGGASSAFGTTAQGGGGGGGGATGELAVGRPGGSGGGGGALTSGFGGGASTASGGGLGNAGAGAPGASSADRRGGGGGGAGGAGIAGTPAGNTGFGGAGIASTCPGVSAVYSVGGNGYIGTNTPTAPVVPGCGGHAGGSIGASTSGASGIVHVWVSTDSEAVAPNKINTSDLLIVSSDSITGDTVSVSVLNSTPNVTEYEYDLNDDVPRSFNSPLTSTGSRTVGDLTRATTVSFRVRGNNSGTPGPWSDPVSVTPGFHSSCRFVSPDGNDGNSGTWASPWRNPSKFGTTLTAGQRGYIRAGTYTGSGAVIVASNSGSEGSPITVTVLPGELWEATIDGDGLTNTRGMVQLKSVDWWVIEGLSIYRAPTDGVYIDGSSNSNKHGHHRIIANKINTCGNSGIYACGRVMGQSIPIGEYWTVDITISRNDVSNTNWPSSGNECISLGGGVDGFSITKNYVHESRQYGIDVKFGARNGSITQNLIRKMYKHCIYCDSACRVNENIDISDNWCEEAGWNNGGYGNGIVVAREADRGGSVGYDQNIRNVRIWNNISVNAGNFGILLSKHVADTNVGDYGVEVTFNTVFNAGMGNECKIDNLLGTVSVLVACNLFAGITGTTFVNSFSGTGTVTDANNTKTLSPGFVNVDALDFRLQTGSPAIGAGNATYNKELDYGGPMPWIGTWSPYDDTFYRTPRTRSGTPDCGAIAA